MTERKYLERAFHVVLPLFKKPSREYIFELVLALMVLASVGLKMQINPSRTSDWGYYEHQLDNLRVVGYLYPPDLPLTLYVLFFVGLFVSSPILVSMVLFSSLLAIPLYFLSVSLSGSKVLGLASASIVLFHDNIYISIRYGLAKTVLGMFLYGLFLLLLFKYGKKLDAKVGLLLLGTSIAVSLTHGPIFLMLLATFFIYGLSQIVFGGNRFAWTARLMAVGIFTIATILSTAFLSPIYSHIASEFVFGLNFPRFYETFTLLSIVASLMAFVGVLSINYVDGNLNHFSSSVAAVGVLLHLGSFMVQHGWGLRFVYLTIIPFSLCLPYLVKKKLCDPWMLAFLTVCFAAPFFSRFIP